MNSTCLKQPTVWNLIGLPEKSVVITPRFLILEWMSSYDKHLLLHDGFVLIVESIVLWWQIVMRRSSYTQERRLELEHCLHNTQYYTRSYQEKADAFWKYIWVTKVLVLVRAMWSTNQHLWPKHKFLLNNTCMYEAYNRAPILNVFVNSLKLQFY